ncbi:mitochondrial fission ELM1 family protein [Henriciella sp.]|uniref:mitochondrial fission ELM1 family protein n=1 Tax=Henriciella sp. TaxID=1968823 RepID=UPI00262A7EA9|nr:mitochondrial fission ELM1 family protein [Henriciella sp.]
MTKPQPTSPNAAQMGPSVWAASDGRAGNAAQVRAIVQALGATERWMKVAHIHGTGHRDSPITLAPRPPWTWLPGGRWPMPQLALPKDQRALFTSPWPDLWIAAGRRSAPYTAAIRDMSGGKTFTVQILDPKSDPANYDLVVVPEHDELEGPNVIRTVGAPSYFAPEDIEQAGQAFADLADENARTCIVILGGDSKAHRFTEDAADRLAEDFQALAGAGWRLRITTSRRTPVPIIAKMRALADRIGARFWAGPEDGPNPYLAWLIYSDAAIVTEDSANMLSDAAWHSLPVHIAPLKGTSPKFDRLHDSLIRRGCARWFEGELERWQYPPLREAGRVADEIVEHLLARHPQPEMKSLDKGGDEDKVVLPDWMK